MEKSVKDSINNSKVLIELLEKKESLLIAKIERVRSNEDLSGEFRDEQVVELEISLHKLRVEIDAKKQMVNELLKFYGSKLEY